MQVRWTQVLLLCLLPMKVPIFYSTYERLPRHQGAWKQVVDEVQEACYRWQVGRVKKRTSSTLARTSWRMRFPRCPPRNLGRHHTYLSIRQRLQCEYLPFDSTKYDTDVFGSMGRVIRNQRKGRGSIFSTTTSILEFATATNNFEQLPTRD